MLKGPLVLTVLSIRLATRFLLRGRLMLLLARGVATNILQPLRFWNDFKRVQKKLKIPKSFVVVFATTVFLQSNSTITYAHSIHKFVFVNIIHIYDKHYIH